MILVPSAAGDPFAGPQLSRLLGDLLLELFERFCFGQVDVAAGVTGEMNMRVVKSWNDGSSAQIDRPRRGKARSELVVSDRGNSAVFDDDGLANRKRIVDGDDLAAVEDEIGGVGLPA